MGLIERVAVCKARWIYYTEYKNGKRYLDNSNRLNFTKDGVTLNFQSLIPWVILGERNIKEYANYLFNDKDSVLVLSPETFETIESITPNCRVRGLQNETSGLREYSITFGNNTGYIVAYKDKSQGFLFYVTGLVCSENILNTFKTKLRQVWVYIDYDNNPVVYEGMYQNKGCRVLIPSGWTNEKVVKVVGKSIQYSAEQIQWCRDNAPEELKDKSDEELCKEMSYIYSILGKD